MAVENEWLEWSVTQTRLRVNARPVCETRVYQTAEAMAKGILEAIDSGWSVTDAHARPKDKERNPT